IPAVGASACISGVIAGYLRYFPFARVDTLVFLGFFITHIQIPALFYIGFWFVTQIQGALISFVSGLAGGVGWYAHLGGFVFGFAFSSLFSKIR
ncbi:MAG: rhomboid family intramembrane serine protease, partial [Deltaproteobacteria bacterium]|nr:rhomboid family intramembrane serine protease [Deltaproteobacteria bacterium]